MQMTTLFKTTLFFFTLLAASTLCIHLQAGILRRASIQSHLFSQPSGGGCVSTHSANSQFFSIISNMFITSYNDCFLFSENKQKHYCSALAFHSYFCIQVLHCFENSCPFSLIIENSNKPHCLYSLSLMKAVFVCISDNGDVYAPYPSPFFALICSGFKVFHATVSSPPIKYSAQSLPPTEGMRPPLQERNDWQGCSASNIHSDNNREEKMAVVLEKTAGDKGQWKRAKRWKESRLYIYHGMAFLPATILYQSGPGYLSLCHILLLFYSYLCIIVEGSWWQHWDEWHHPIRDREAKRGNHSFFFGK